MEKLRRKMFLKVVVEDIGVGDNLEDDHLSDDSDDDDTTTMTNHHWPWCVSILSQLVITLYRTTAMSRVLLGYTLS